MTSVVPRRQEQGDPGEYSDASQENDQNNSGNDAAPPESDYDSHGSDDSDLSDRENSDGKETERRVDDDEDRSNPQYIPKRGTFYEHDDRTAASGEETTTSSAEGAPAEEGGGGEPQAERRRPPRKSEICDKWSHDKYNENEQIPKSRDELVAVYGYDIRNEDAPPHARRNRRYGRGPNKYTRTWEDEEAYKRQVNQATPNHRKLPNPEDFPELEKTVKKISKKSRAPRSRSQPNKSNESLENGALRRNASTNQKAKPPAPRPRARADRPPPIEHLTITASLNNTGGQGQRKVNTAIGQQLPVPTPAPAAPTPAAPVSHAPAGHAPAGHAPAPAPPRRSAHQQQNHQHNNSTHRPAQQQIQQQQSQQQQKPVHQPQQAQNAQQPQPSGATENRAGPKRYSNLRHRPLAETYSPQPQHRFVQDQYQQSQPSGGQHQSSPVPQVHPQPQLMHQVRVPAPTPPAAGAPAAPPAPPLQPMPQQHSQQVRLSMMEQQQLVPHPHQHPMHNIPQPHTMGPLQPSQGYAPPAIMPAQYMQGGNNAAVYGGAPMYAQPPAPYPHQLYQHHNYASPGGVTYYSPAEQEQPPPRTTRRPTAAIPIVRPTQERPANSSDKDNIDRIVENMFVRKPWPATRGRDSKDKAQETRSSQDLSSKESSQSNSLTSSVSTDSRPSTERTEGKEAEPKEAEPKPAEPEPKSEAPHPVESTRTSEEKEVVAQQPEESITNDA